MFPYGALALMAGFAVMNGHAALSEDISKEEWVENSINRGYTLGWYKKAAEARMFRRRVRKELMATKSPALNMPAH